MVSAFQPVPAFETAFQQDAGGPPVQLTNIPNFSYPSNSGSWQRNFSVYWTGATSYSIAPALDTGWSFDTGTGILTLDTDVVATFGPFTITATNSEGSDDSNTFTISVVNVVAGVGGGAFGRYTAFRRRRKKRQ